MIVMSGRENMEEVIYRHLNREATPAEETELASWLTQRAENQAEYDDIVKIWNESLHISYAEEFDQKAAWESLENKINHPAPLSVKRIPFFSRSMRAAAAIVCLGLLAEGIYYLVRPKPAERIQILAVNGNQKIQLPDGSVILLRKGGSLKYSADFPEKGRRVELSGEAYFDVRHEENRPFVIHTNMAIIEEIGTSFLVRSTDQAEQVFVTTGSLRVTDIKDISKTIILSGGQSVSVIGKIFDKESITDSNYLAWRNGILQFDHVTLRKMIADLNENFQTNILLSDALAAKSDTIKVNFRFENNSLDQVLEEIHVTTGWIADRSNNRIILHE
jgi:transmembrane sensor